MLEHGGRLRKAALHYGIDEAHWLDLSTGLALGGLLRSPRLPSVPGRACPKPTMALSKQPAAITAR